MERDERLARKRWLNLLRLFVSVGALALIIWQINLPEALKELREAELGLLLIAALLFALSLVIRAGRWLLLIRSLNPHVPFVRLLRLYFVAAFFNTFLPSSFGGDVVRALELTRDADTSAAVGTVFLDRMSGLMTLALMGLLILPFQIGRLDDWLIWLLIILTSGILLVGGIILEGRLLRKLTTRLPFGLSLTGDGALAKIYAAISSCGWRSIVGAFGVSIVFNVINVIINWLCGRAVGTGISLGHFFVVTPLIAVSGLIPSIGGWGVREAISAAIFSSVDDEKAVAFGFVLGLVMASNGLVGGLIYLAESLLKTTTTSAVED